MHGKKSYKGILIIDCYRLFCDFSSGMCERMNIFKN